MSARGLISRRGAKFFMEGEGEEKALMFVFHYDIFTREGPRPATEEDTLQHPNAWAAFVAETEGETPVFPGAAEATVTTIEGEGPTDPATGVHALRRASAAALERDKAARGEK